jgi:1,4-dihydroxy-2-naphthoate octaprenyltransferase
MTAATASLGFGERARLWGVAVRAYSFPASIVPVLAGSAFAAYEMSRLQAQAAVPGIVGLQFNWLGFVLALVAGVLYHTGCNLINDYYDHKKGVDREGTFGGSGVLVAGTMTPAQIMQGAIVTLALGTLLGLVLAWQLHRIGVPFGWPLLAVGAAGLIGAIWYTSGNVGAKYVALGSPLVFIMMGIGYVVGAYLVQMGGLANWGAAVAVSLPVGFLVAAILQANDVRDIVDDRAAGIRTIATQLGPTGARAYYSFLLFAPYVTVVLLALFGVTPWTALAPLLTLPLALPLHKLFWTVRDERSDKLMPSVEGTAKLHMAFGLLFSIGILLGTLPWFSRG